MPRKIERKIQRGTPPLKPVKVREGKPVRIAGEAFVHALAKAHGLTAKPV